ncbi:hypothetical protein [Streptomyces sp. NPDC058674]|uniref:hypothetical protein n=1 Tax=Streptomyces sp. NPDC058674 TaxID=3346592 RepID=UPI00365C8BE0
MPTVPTPHDHALPAETLDEKEARLSPLAPLRGLIARTFATTPVHLGPGGTEALVDELTLAVAIYTAREVLPSGLLDADNAVNSQWEVQIRRNGVEQWERWSRAYDDLGQAREELAYQESRRTSHFRLVRVTTIRTVEAATAQGCDDPHTP